MRHGVRGHASWERAGRRGGAGGSAGAAKRVAKKVLRYGGWRVAEGLGEEKQQVRWQACGSVLCACKQMALVRVTRDGE